ncbi:MAG: TIGR00730 family Rossman fold protein [Planctomycetes bacterium]|nr:TIGR00730 family Rossman fold protein [Planctomycetota bacterium]
MPDTDAPRFAAACLFCGSNAGDRPAYAAAARDLGGRLAAAGLDLIYGGGRVGLMGMAADAALAAGGRVIGVIPEALFPREVEHRGLTELRVVPSMHERKRLMYDLADVFVTLPGGLGTLDELFEVLTWSQLGIHQKPCGLLNVEGYFDPLLAFLDGATLHRFIPPEHRGLLVADADPERLLARLRTWRPPAAAKWLPDGAR